MKIIYDCDNTMGLEYRDIDDGLALLYLYKNPNVNLLGVTLTFGNDNIEKVIASTQSLKEKFSLDIKLYNGNSNGEDFETNDAAHYIVEETKKYPNEITILATGSLKNIADAYKIDKNIFTRIKDLVIMGGITEDLIINNKKMNELNMSISSESSYLVLKNSKNPKILTGNSCLVSKLYIEEITTIINSFAFYNNELYGRCKDWIKYHSADYNVDYIIVWDLLAAVYTTNQEIFEKEETTVEINREYLKTGFMKRSKNGNQITIPKLKDKEKYINIVKENYLLK